MSKPLNLIGKRFGLLTVVERKPSDAKGQSMWLCRCDCGNEKIIRGHDLTQGKTQSCGCTRKYNCGLYKHGLSHTRLHGIWRNIKGRCYNPNNPCYQHYGGRGITVCDEWKNDFQKFYDWSMENGYQENLSIDRIDANGAYSPQNCRWADSITQANNKRNNKVFTAYGKTMTVAQWSRETGVKYGDIQNRLNYGYSFEEAIDPNFTRIYFKNAENRKVHDLCVERGVPYGLVIQRVQHGWDIEKALSLPSKRSKNKTALS